MSYSKKDKPFQALGVDALFGDLPPEEETKILLPLEAIALPETQPRRYFDLDKMAQLAQSIRAHGILQPLLVRPHANGYELVAGERRFRAAREVGLTEVPAIIKDLTDEAARQLALIENLHREDLNPVEEVEGILELLAITLNLTVLEVISALHYLKNKKEGKVMDNAIRNESEPQIFDSFEQLGQNWYSFTCNRLPLLNLPKDLLEALREGKLAYTKAKALAKIKDDALRTEFLEQTIAEGLSQREIQQRIKDKISSRGLQGAPAGGAHSPSLASAEEENSLVPTPPSRLHALTNRLKKVKLWQSHPQAWKKVETRLTFIENLLAELEIEEAPTEKEASPN